LLLEAHPPVDSEGQTTEPNLELLSQQLDKAVGNDTAAIHWDLARDTLQAANGIPAVVGLQADLAPSPDAPNGAAPQTPGAIASSPGVANPSQAPSAAGAPQSPGVPGAAAPAGSAANSAAPAEPPTKTLAPVYAPGTGPGTSPAAATSVPKPTSAAPKPPAPNSN